MAKCGMPTMALKKENCFAVLMEAFSERASSDPDVDRSKASENRFGTNPKLIDTKSGRELAEWLCKRADEYRTIDKNGHEKKLRSDASVAFAGIVKPDMEYITALPREAQERFLRDANEVLTRILMSKKLVMVGVAWHFDELAPHLHYVALDPEYKLGKKLGLPLFNQLNHEFPQKMREKGWELQDLGRYDVEAAKLMTPEQKAAYKEERIAEKKEAKKHGQTSKQFKAQKDIERAEKSVKDAKAFVEKSEREINVAHLGLQERTKRVEALEQKILTREEDISRQKNELRNEGKELDIRASTLDEEEKSLLKRKEQFEIEVRREAKKQVQAVLPEIEERVTNTILRSPKADLSFWSSVVMIAIQKFTRILERNYNLKLSEHVNKWLFSHNMEFTDTVFKDVVKENLEKEVEKTFEDPSIYMGRG